MAFPVRYFVTATKVPVGITKGFVMNIRFRLSVAVSGMIALSACLPEGTGLGSGGAVAVGTVADDAPLCAPGLYANLKGQPESAAEIVPSPKRVIRPGFAVSMDHNPSRTNIAVDESGVIQKVYCG